MENLFISYRRDDSAAYAGRICDRMNALVGSRRVFMDVEDIGLGQNFATTIDQTLGQCSHVLVVIGPRWHEILLARAQQPGEDYVVHELAAALERKKVVVPVFVGGAKPAMLTALPPALADLHFHQAIEIRDDSFTEDCDRLAAKLQLKRRGVNIPLVAGAAVLVLLVLGLVAAKAGLGPWHASHERRQQVARLLSTAQVQVQQAQYPSAFQTYGQMLALEPDNVAAMDGQANAAMLRLDYYAVIPAEGEKAEVAAGRELAQLETVIEAGLARTNGKDQRAADLLAHLGWLHYMNEKIAAKEFGNAEKYFAQSLKIDAGNVYAHAFWGNWLLQTGGNLSEALKHFAAALVKPAQRELVRSLQLGGLLDDDQPGARGAFVRALNEVRVNNEPLDPDVRSRISYLYSPSVSSMAELHETLAAVPAGDAWKTFLWLDPEQAVEAHPALLKDFVQANLSELAGNRQSALTQYKGLESELRAEHFAGRMADYTAEAIRRLSE